MRVGKLSNNIWLLYRVCECHRLACGCRRCWCAGGGLSGRCVRSVLLLLLLARHPRSADCCAAVGRAKRKGRKERKGNRGVAVRRGEERRGLVGLSGTANSDYMWTHVTSHRRSMRAWIPGVKRPHGRERGATSWGPKMTAKLVYL